MMKNITSDITLCILRSYIGNYVGKNNVNSFGAFVVCFVTSVISILRTLCMQLYTIYINLPIDVMWMIKTGLIFYGIFLLLNVSFRLFVKRYGLVDYQSKFGLARYFF
jgi:hypothetical protein